MTEPLIFTVHGTPRPKARPRFVHGRVVTTTQPAERLWLLGVSRAVEEALLNRGADYPLFTGPVRVSMVFTFVPPRTKQDRIGSPHTVRCDVDNLYKGIADMMERHGVYRNDSQVAQAPVVKWWGARAGVVVTVEPIEVSERGPSEAASVPPAWMVAAIAKGGSGGSGSTATPR